MKKARIGENVPLITKQVDASIVISRERINTLRERERDTHTHTRMHTHAQHSVPAQRRQIHGHCVEEMYGGHGPCAIAPTL
jgi:hypothetical protein